MEKLLLLSNLKTVRDTHALSAPHWVFTTWFFCACLCVWSGLLGAFQCQQPVSWALWSVNISCLTCCWVSAEVSLLCWEARLAQQWKFTPGLCLSSEGYCGSTVAYSTEQPVTDLGVSTVSWSLLSLTGNLRSDINHTDWHKLICCYLGPVYMTTFSGKMQSCSFGCPSTWEWHPCFPKTQKVFQIVKTWKQPCLHVNGKNATVWKRASQTIAMWEGKWLYACSN